MSDDSLDAAYGEEPCPHPHARLSNVRMPSVGDAKEGSSISLEADCECGATVFLDTRITDVIEQ